MGFSVKAVFPLTRITLKITWHIYCEMESNKSCEDLAELYLVYVWEDYISTGIFCDAQYHI